MKKTIVFLLSLIILLCTACSSDKDVYVVQEKMFIQQCNNVYLNPEDYEGKTIKIEGFCSIFEDTQANILRYGVIRKSPGCCGNDGLTGFLFTYNGAYPKENDWIEITGKIELIKMSDYTDIVIRAEEVVVKDTRGADFVSN